MQNTSSLAFVLSFVLLTQGLYCVWEAKVVIFKYIILMNRLLIRIPRSQLLRAVFVKSSMIVHLLTSSRQTNEVQLFLRLHKKLKVVIKTKSWKSTMTLKCLRSLHFSYSEIEGCLKTRANCLHVLLETAKQMPRCKSKEPSHSVKKEMLKMNKIKEQEKKTKSPKETNIKQLKNKRMDFDKH